LNLKKANLEEKTAEEQKKSRERNQVEKEELNKRKTEALLEIGKIEVNKKFIDDATKKIEREKIMSVKGFGTKFQYTIDDSANWLDVGELINPTPPSPTKEIYDTTHHGSASGTRTKAGSLVDSGQCSIEVMFDPADTGHLLLMTRANTAFEVPQPYRFVYSDGTIVAFAAICTGYSPTVPMNDKLTQTFNFDVSGVIDNNVS
jgi:hypothetical protein